MAGVVKRYFARQFGFQPTRTCEAPTLSSNVRHTVRRVFKKSARRLNRAAVLESLETAGVEIEIEADYALYDCQESEAFRAESEG